VRSLASAAPSGRAFAAIATLSEISQAAESHLEAGKDALRSGDIPRAETEWTRAATVMEQMASEARRNQAPRRARPEFLGRR
jgi:hypothetical protein